MEFGKQTDVIYTDWSKVFDSVNHSVLIAKLRFYGVPNSLIFWYSSYLTNRCQKVKVNGLLSNIFPTLSGVPQGSHLSSLLFAFFILDISMCFKFCDYKLFAHDLKLYTMSYQKTITCMLQEDLDIRRLIVWCHTNGLNLY